MKDKWTIQIAATELRDAAKQQAEYHASRTEWWEAEYESAERALREKGIDIRAYQQTGGQQATAVLDPDLANRWSECQSKIKTHRTAQDRFAAWEQFFAACSDTYLDVDSSDYEYFDLGGARVAS